MKRLAFIFAALLCLAGCGGGGTTIIDPPAQGQTAPPVPAITAEIPPTAGDFTPTFNAEVARTCATKTDRIFNLTAGQYLFLTQPQPIPCALSIVGPGIGAVYLLRSYDGDFLQWGRGSEHGGGSLERVSIVAALGSNGGTAVKLIATPDVDPTDGYYNRHIFTIRDVQIGRERDGTNTSWDYGLVLDGSQNPENTIGIAPGIRDIWVDHTIISGTRIAHALLDHAKGVELTIQCRILLPGAFYGIQIRNFSEGTSINTRTCKYELQDAASNWVQLNGVRTEAKTGDPTLLP